ncbi:hypothetical protein D3C86_1714130 [compost metagenome]
MAAQRILRIADRELEGGLRRISDGDQPNHGVDVAGQLANQLAAHLLQPKPNCESAGQREQHQRGERGEPATQQASDQRERHTGDQSEHEKSSFDHAHQPSGDRPI